VRQDTDYAQTNQLNSVQPDSNAVFGMRLSQTETDQLEKILLRPSEAAEVIGVSRARAYELIAKGVIPSMRIGSSLRVPVEALRAWVAGQLHDGDTSPKAQA
jgi:excisionase family DNA binding protein